MSAERAEPELERDLSRAEWMRGAGAIIMRELIGGAFDAANDLTEAEATGIQLSANGLISTFAHESLSKLWATAYLVSDHMTNKAFRIVDTNYERAHVRDKSGIIDNGFYDYTFFGNAKQSVREINKTVSHFPISLTRSVCSHAVILDIDHERFKPHSLSDISEMLESPDIQLMIDQSLFAANGFWQGFSTNINGLATTGFVVSSPYFFENGRVSYSGKALKLMRNSVRTINSPKDMKEYGESGPHRVATSTSGCPARYYKQSGLDCNSDELSDLSAAFGKSPVELTDGYPHTVAQLGVSYVARCLRKANSLFMDEIDSDEKRRDLLRRYSAMRAAEFDMS